MLCAMLSAGGLVGGRLQLEPLSLPKQGDMTRVVLRVEHASRVAGKRPGMSGWGLVAAGDPRVIGERLYFFALTRRDAPLPLRAGTLALYGALKSVPPRGGLGSFNGFLRSLGIRAELSPAWPRGDPAAPTAYAAFRERLADRMAEILGLGFDRRPDLAAIYRAMMLGRKSGLTPAQKNIFIRSGTMHLFAINGLHIGIVALAAHALLTLLRSPRPLSALAVLSILWLDVDSTGASPSALRAFTMVAVLEAGHVFWLPSNPLAALAFAASVLLALDPRDAFSASFQMSFGVVAALILLGVPLAAHLQREARAYLPPDAGYRPLAWLLSHLAQGAGFGAAAAAVSAITGIEYFGTFAPVGFAANLLLMPLATLVIIAGFASILCGLAHAFLLGQLFNAAARLLLQAIAHGVARAAATPFGTFSGHYRFDVLGPAALAALLLACLWGYGHHWSKAAGGFLPPFVIAGATLVLGVSYP